MSKTLTTQHDDDEDIDVFDHAVLDGLDDEDFELALSDPKAFKAKHPTSPSQTDADAVHSANTDDDGKAEPPRQPATEQTLDGAPTTADATADTDNGAGSDVEIENPYRDDGIPDIWMIDPDTGENYENGMIMGKYRTPDAAFKGALEAQKLIGRKRLDPDAETRGYVDPQQQTGFLATVPLDDATNQQVWNHSYSYAMDRYASDIAALGLTQEDLGEDLEGLRAADPQLYREIRKTAEERYPQAASFVQNYIATQQQRDVLQEQSMEQGYNLFVDAFEGATGLESDEEDQANLQGAYNGVLTGILNIDRQYQDYMQKNPTVNIYTNPQVAQFYATYYEVVNGIPVLSPEKVANAALLANNHLYQSAIKRSAVSQHQAAMRQVAETAPVFPTTATTAQNDGATGSAMPRPTDEEFYSPDYFDRLIKAFNGDEEKAQQFYDRIVDEKDEEWTKARGVQRTTQRANY